MLAILRSFQPQSMRPAAFTILRVAIGWHFLWEGWVKLSQPHWSAAGYLQASWGPLAPLFQIMAETNWVMDIINTAIPYSLFAAGLGLMLGLFSRTSILVAMGLLAMFIAAMPPFDFSPAREGLEWQAYFADLGAAQWAGKMGQGSEGNYFAINKNLVEMLALFALFTVNQKTLYGFDALMDQSGETPKTKNAMQEHAA